MTPDGTSILLKFKSLKDVQKYITNVYLAHQNMQITFYQLKYIKIAMENIDIPLILNSVKRSRDSKRKQKWYATILGTAEHEMIKAKRQARHINVLGTHEHERVKAKRQARYSNILGTAEHETIKAKKQAHYANILGTAKHETIKEKMRARYTNIKARARKLYANTTTVCSNDFSGNITKFRLEIKKGPYFICAVCNRCLYRKSVLMFVENKYINFYNIHYNKVDSYDGC